LFCTMRKVEGLEKRLGLGLARSRSRLVAKIRRLGVVSVSWNCRKVLVSVSSRTKNRMSRSRSRKLRSRLHPCEPVIKPATLPCTKPKQSIHEYYEWRETWSNKDSSKLQQVCMSTRQQPTLQNIHSIHYTIMCTAQNISNTFYINFEVMKKTKQ